MASWVGPFLLLILFEVLADIFAKEWSLRDREWLRVTALGFYMLGNAFWLYSLRDGAGLARGCVLFSMTTAAIGVVLGVFYRESYSATQVAGIALGCLATYLLVK